MNVSREKSDSDCGAVIGKASIRKMAGEHVDVGRNHGTGGSWWVTSRVPGSESDGTRSARPNPSRQSHGAGATASVGTVSGDEEGCTAGRSASGERTPSPCRRSPGPSRGPSLHGAICTLHVESAHPRRTCQEPFLGEQRSNRRR